ncbi:methyltransferase domain-containing protein [Candidatus Saccharibacteria bacterium]|nr:methyltransferase domain-containing protein [Candidatus Saccharibacteria bacterium]
MSSLYILGRQPEIGIAELESLLGANNIKPIGTHAVLSSQDANHIPFSRLGGCVKVCKLLTQLPYTDWNKLITYLFSAAPQFLNYLPEGKLNLGISAYGFDVSPAKINASALQLKKIIKNAGKSVRIVPNVKNELNSAQVIHNKLTSKNGWELVLIKDKNQTILAQTVHVQDIEAYAARDQKRPKRDARVGMLPPKLAQIIVNMASTGNNRFGATVLDPFCGTGVVLQEAAIMGFSVYGTDIEPRMIEFSTENLNWLDETHEIGNFEWFVEEGDAMQVKWSRNFDFVAGETYLGRPLNSLPDEKTLQKIVSDCDHIHKRFLENIAKQIKPGVRLCLAVPAWKTNKGYTHLNVLDYLEKLGYTRQSFVHADSSRLIYHREGQTVGRELVVLTRK